MPELFVPLSKSAAPTNLAVPEVVPEVVPETMGLLEGDSLELEDAENQALPQPLTTVETLFFYGRDGNGAPELYQVNVAEGTLAIASEPLELFPTVLNGLLAAEPTFAPWLTPDVDLLQDNVPTSDSLEPESLESESLEAEFFEVEVPESTTFATALPATDLLESESLEPKFLETDSLEPEFLKTEALETESLEPEGPKPETLEPETLETEALLADSPGSESEGAAPLETAALLSPATAVPSVFTLVQGTDGKNFLIGSAADNALFSLGGDDLILTVEGNNLAFGGEGNDTIIGGPGDDILFGGLGNDVLDGGAGNDHLFGGNGDDILYGGGGANVLVGGAGADIFRLGTPETYGGALVGATELSVGSDTLVDFSIAEGDRLDFSLIAAQPAFAGVELLPFLSFVQVGANTEVQVTTPLGQTTTEAILLDVEADTITPSSLSFTTPAKLPPLK